MDLLSRLRLASSSGAARTSSSSCLIIVPIRITLAGCSTRLLTSLPPPSTSPSTMSGIGAVPSGVPSGPTTTTCCCPVPSAASLMTVSS